MSDNYLFIGRRPTSVVARALPKKAIAPGTV
jgi:hypothetical protein